MLVVLAASSGLLANPHQPFLMTSPEPDNAEAGGVFYHPRKLMNGLTWVNPIQLYLDFMLYGGRGQEQADFLVEHALGFRE